MRPRTSTEHGQYGFARRENCRCDACVEGMRRYNKQLALKRARGQSRRVPAGPVRVHVQRLMDAGLTYNQIIMATNGVVTKEQVRNLIEGNEHWHDKEVTWVMRHTMDALMAVTYDKGMAAGFRYVPAIGVQRRIQALRWLGYTIPMLAEHTDIGYSALHRHTRSERVTTWTVAKVDELYRKLAGTVGPDERERWRAYRLGFLPPAAWDDEDIDDPDLEPDLSRVVCIVDNCSRSVTEMSLCETHMRRVRERDAVDKAQKFRVVVEGLSRQNPRDRERLVHELTELRELGFTVEAAAVRLGRPLSYVRKIWWEAA